MLIIKFCSKYKKTNKHKTNDDCSFEYTVLYIKIWLLKLEQYIACDDLSQLFPLLPAGSTEL